jgi:hypothetical protein
VLLLCRRFDVLCGRTQRGYPSIQARMGRPPGILGTQKICSPQHFPQAFLLGAELYLAEENMF